MTIDADEMADSEAPLPVDFTPVTSLGFIPARNDVYVDSKGHKRRLIHLERSSPGTRTELYAFLIDIGPEAQHAFPYALPRGDFLSLLQNHWRKQVPMLLAGPLPQRKKTSPKAATEVTRRWNALTKAVTVDKCPSLDGRCLAEDLRLLYRPGRKKLLLMYEKALGVTAKTLMDWLTRYWRGGMNRDALRPNFEARGEDIRELDEDQLLARRPPGRSRGDGQPTFRLSATTKRHMLKAVEFLDADKRETVASAYKELVRTDWMTIDSTGQVQLLPIGQMPSEQQLYRLLRKNLPVFYHLFRKAGPGHVFNNYVGKTGTTLQQAVCAGHQYEVDSTQADIWLVSTENRNKIIGKPTLYFIVDRYSKLITGWHATLDSPSWHGACEAFISLFEDPQELCKELDVKFQGMGAHPATGLAPSELIADRGGEYISTMSEQLTTGIRVSVVNLPAHMCSSKGIVECSFMQHHVTLRNVAPGYQPPVEAMKRHGANYEHDAEWTLDQFRAHVMEHVYRHNLRMHAKMLRRMHALEDGYRPIPVEVFTLDAQESGTMLTALDPVDVYWELMAQKRPAVTNAGVLLHGLLYSCPDIEARDWLIKAGFKRFRVDVKYDRRLTDRVFILNPEAPGTFFVATLTPAYEMYGRRSFAEAQRALRIIKNQAVESVRYNLRLDLQFDYETRNRTERAHKLVMEVIARAKQMGESRTSGGPELREEEARKRSVGRAEKRQQGLLSSPQPADDVTEALLPPGRAPEQSGPSQPADESAEIATSTGMSEAARDATLELVIVKDPLRALHNKGH